MPISFTNVPVIRTVDISSVAASFTHVFDFDDDAMEFPCLLQQILWANTFWTTDATVGTRQPVLRLRDASATLVLQILSTNTFAASIVLGSANWLQGNSLIPETIFGINRSIPSDGLYALNGYSMVIFDANAVSAGDAFTGMFQLECFG